MILIILAGGLRACVWEDKQAPLVVFGGPVAATGLWRSMTASRHSRAARCLPESLSSIGKNSFFGTWAKWLNTLFLELGAIFQTVSDLGALGGHAASRASREMVELSFRLNSFAGVLPVRGFNLLFGADRHQEMSRLKICKDVEARKLRSREGARQGHPRGGGLGRFTGEGLCKVLWLLQAPFKQGSGSGFCQMDLRSVMTDMIQCRPHF